MRAIGATQTRRLEAAMCNARTWDVASFRAAFVEHPLLRHLGGRLVFSVARGALHTFRVAEDGSLADLDDAPFTLAGDDAIAIVHPIHLDAATIARWSERFADYEIVQPFAQLAREVFRIEAGEADRETLDRWRGRVVDSRALLGLAARGWSHESSPDGGVFCTYSREFPGGGAAEITFEPGVYLGKPSEHPSQTLGALTLRAPLVRFGELTPIRFSELVRDLETLR